MPGDLQEAKFGGHLRNPRRRLHEVTPTKGSLTMPSKNAGGGLGLSVAIVGVLLLALILLPLIIAT